AQMAGRWLGQRLSALLSAEWPKVYVRPALALIVVAGSLSVAANSGPHFRLYTNAFGGGAANAGYYFPQDEFYDASMRDAMFEIAKRARPGATVASESHTLASYYAQRAGRSDLNRVFVSDASALQQLHA